MSNRFQQISLGTCGSANATAPRSVAMVDRTISALFDDELRADVTASAGPESRYAWRMAVVDVHLPALTRRPFVVRILAAMNATCGDALVRLTCDGQTTSRQLMAAAEPKAANQTLSLAIRRSTQPRDRLRLILWAEATARAEGGEAQAVVDSVDVRAR